MKHTIIKGVGLVVVTALTLTGCNLIEIDESMQANEDIAKIEKAYAVNAATYTGGEVTVAEAVADFNSEYNNMAYMYSYYLGMDMSDDQISEIANEVLQEKVEEEVIAAHFDSEGNTLTEEETAEVASTAESDYESIHEEALSEATGANDKYKEANAQVLLTRVGQTKEQIEAAELQSKKAEKMKQMLQDSVTEITDEELQTAYDTLLASNKETYDADPASYGSDMTNASDDTVIAYVPEGYRTVRHILVIPEDSVLTAYTDAKSALSTAEDNLAELEASQNSDSESETAEDATAEDTETEDTAATEADIEAAKTAVETAKADLETARKACLENVSAKTDEIYAKLAAGTSFADVMAEYGEDPGMQDETTAQTGYYVCASSTNWQSEFTEGAMALENVGDYSKEPVVSGSGVHIIEYYKDVTPGEVGLDSIHDALYTKTLNEKKTSTCDETVSGWVEEVAPSYSPEVLVNAVNEAA